MALYLYKFFGWTQSTVSPIPKPMNQSYPSKEKKRNHSTDWINLIK